MSIAPELNALNINGFVLEINKIPIIKFTCQSVDFPGLTLPEAEQPTPFITAHVPGDHIDYDDLTFSFMIDERMRNYNALRLWITALGKPEKFEQFAQFIKGYSESPDIEFMFKEGLKNQYSDVTITVLTNHHNPQFIFRLTDAFPISLSGFSLSVTESTSSPITATCTMKFSSLHVEAA